MPAFAQSTESYEDFLRRGSEAFQGGDLETALLLFTKAQQLHDHPRVRLSIARIHGQLGECAAAKANYLMLIESQKADPEIRQQAGTGLAELATCGQAEELAATEPTAPTVMEAEAVVPAPPRQSNALRVMSVSMVAGGATLSIAGAVVASGVFLSKATRRCHGLGATLDDQIAACEELAMIERTEFWEAHVHARREVETHRLVATTLLAVGLVSASFGTALLLESRADKRRMSVGLGPGHVSFTVAF